eukprot:XP_001705775.1 Hypothetical protein GL50803_32069 [Giardia lamblia ATCC 50803]
MQFWGVAVGHGAIKFYRAKKIQTAARELPPQKPKFKGKRVRAPTGLKIEFTRPFTSDDAYASSTSTSASLTGQGSLMMDRDCFVSYMAHVLNLSITSSCSEVVPWLKIHLTLIAGISSAPDALRTVQIADMWLGASDMMSSSVTISPEFSSVSSVLQRKPSHLSRRLISYRRALRSPRLSIPICFRSSSVRSIRERPQTSCLRSC